MSADSTHQYEPELAALLTAPNREAFYAELAAGEPVRRGRYLDGRVAHVRHAAVEALCQMRPLP